MDPNSSQELLLEDVVVREELVLTEVVAPGAWSPPLLEVEAKAACKACKSRNRALWHGVCAWCCADEDTRGDC